MLPRLASAIGLVLLCAWSVLRDGRAPSPVPATAPDVTFSAERAMRHVAEIAVHPHPMGTADHDRVRDYIIAQITALGVRAQTQRTTAIGTRYPSAGRVENILAWLPGSTPNAKAAVLLAAHYDGVGAGPAAADDGAGTAALLETMRALRARKQPLAHDVFFLFTDGEESGLLGAAAFAREHPWAKDVAVVLNFEARGTSGRSFMFETGPGNLDAVRALRRAGNATAGSVFTAIYRVLPNDTDLSELSVLGTPALNFAFTDGVERYHTSHDDVAHLNPGSLQHHGSQMLALAREFGDGVLPRPRTGDAVFFDFPLVGLVVYPQSLSIPVAIIAIVLVGLLVWRVRSGIVVGALAALGTVALATGASWLIGWHLSGPAQWSGLVASAMVLLAMAIVAACRALALRWSTEPGLYTGALVIWLIIAVSASIASPGVGYLFAWPLIFGAVAALSTRRRTVLEWIAAAVALLMLAGFAYGTSVIMLGLKGVGAIALGALSSLVLLILEPRLAPIAGARGSRPSIALWPLAGAVVLGVFALFVVHVDGDHPMHSSLVYAVNADSGDDAWLGTFGHAHDAWTRGVIGAHTASPPWISRLADGRFMARPVARVAIEGPKVILARDTTINGARRVVLRVTAPLGTTALVMRAPGAHVLTASIDGRVIDTTRYRVRSSVWSMQFWAPPDTGGTIVALSIPLGTRLTLDVASRRPGLPAMPGMSILARPDFVVPGQEGDESIVYRRYTF